MTIEEACEVMHDAYEEAAVAAGWETQERSRKPWADVPEENKETMRAAVRALLAALAPDLAAKTPLGPEDVDSDAISAAFGHSITPSGVREVIATAALPQFRRDVQ